MESYVFAGVWFGFVLAIVGMHVIIDTYLLIWVDWDKLAGDVSLSFSTLLHEIRECSSKFSNLSNVSNFKIFNIQRHVHLSHDTIDNIN